MADFFITETKVLNPKHFLGFHNRKKQDTIV